jgi:hypothetical protein
MPIEFLDDWDRRLARQDAFWECAVLDRPLVVMEWPKASAPAPPPSRHYSSEREWWMDTQRIVEEAVWQTECRVYGGDALPRAWPNLGPEVFSAFFGQEMEYTADTSWSRPMLLDWSQAERIRFSEENVYWLKLREITQALLDAGRGRFYTGLTDLHPGGDALAAFRDPALLNLDLLNCPGAVKALLARITAEFCHIYDSLLAPLRAAGQAVTTWLNIVSTKRWHVPSNDFSCMISQSMFEEIFLPGIVAECRHLDAAIYHLDGPGALRHLDSLLAVPEINAIQWVYGAGQGRASGWLEVYRRCQGAGKGIQLTIELDELTAIMEHLRPEGVWLAVHVRNQDEADAVLRRVTRWT